MRKPGFWICENKGARSAVRNRTADQLFVFATYRDTIHLLSKSETIFCGCAARFLSDLRSWLETPKTGFLMMPLIYMYMYNL